MLVVEGDKYIIRRKLFATVLPHELKIEDRRIPGTNKYYNNVYHNTEHNYCTSQTWHLLTGKHN